VSNRARNATTLRVFAVSVGLCAAIGAAVAAGVQLKALGFEVQGQSDYVATPIPASETELKFWVGVSPDAEGHVLSGSWVAEDVGTAAPPETLIDKADAKVGGQDKSVVFSLSRPNNGWPLGKYRLEIREGDQLLLTHKFEIVAAGS
jgi:hypothetical protein